MNFKPRAAQAPFQCYRTQWHWHKMNPTQKIINEIQKNTQDVEVFLFCFCRDQLASIRLHRWLHSLIHKPLRLSDSQAAGWPGDWRDQHKVKSLIIPRAGVNSSASHLSCHRVLEQENVSPQTPSLV